jgi:Holliday junction resolvase
MNSRNKGKVGEREFAALLREHGFDARRGQQFSGGADSPDVVSDALAWLHFEIKRVQHLNLTDACVQAEGDLAKLGTNAAGAAKIKKLAWVVAHRRNHAPWLITMRAEFFFELLREFDPAVLTPRREDAKCAEGLTANYANHANRNCSGGTPERTAGTVAAPLADVPPQTISSLPDAGSEQQQNLNHK